MSQQENTPSVFLQANPLYHDFIDPLSGKITLKGTHFLGSDIKILPPPDKALLHKLVNHIASGFPNSPFRFGKFAGITGHRAKRLIEWASKPLPEIVPFTGDTLHVVETDSDGVDSLKIELWELMKKAQVVLQTNIGLLEPMQALKVMEVSARILTNLDTISEKGGIGDESAMSEEQLQHRASNLAKLLHLAKVKLVDDDAQEASGAPN